MKKRVFSDNIWGEIYTSTLEQYFIGTKIFNRLHNVHQTSMLYFVYPTMTISRFEHSLGTMHIAGKMFECGIANTSKPIVTEFLGKFRKIFENWIKERKEYGGLCKGNREELLVFFKENITNNKGHEYINSLLSNNIVVIVQENLKVYSVLLQAIRIVGLLHDLGHPPYSHVVENSIQLIENTISEDKELLEKGKYFSQIYNYYINKQLHESIGDKLITTLLENYTYNSDKVVTNIYNTLVIDTVQSILRNEDDFTILHQIVSGALDADRLDYLQRCAFASGLKSKINSNRIINSLRLLKKESGYIWGINSKNIHDIQLFYLDYQEHYDFLIGHHAYVKLDKILQNVIVNIAKYYLINNKDSKTNQEKLPMNISGLWHSIANVYNNVLLEKRVVQWDDNWLMVVIKNFLYDNTIEKNDLLKVQIEEILSNSKNYHSLIKRKEDFNIINNTVIQEMSSESNFYVLCFQKIINIIYKMVNKDKKNNNNNINGLNDKEYEKAVRKDLRDLRVKLKQEKSFIKSLLILKDKINIMILDEEQRKRIYLEALNFDENILKKDKYIYYVLSCCVPTLSLEEKFNGQVEKVIDELKNTGIEIEDIFIAKTGKNINMQELYQNYLVYDDVIDDSKEHNNIHYFNEYDVITDLGASYDKNPTYFCYYKSSNKYVDKEKLKIILANRIKQIIMDELNIIE